MLELIWEQLKKYYVPVIVGLVVAWLHGDSEGAD